MGRNTPHRMKANRTANHLRICVTAEIGPFLVQADFFVKGDASNFIGQRGDAFGRYATTVGNGLGRIGRVHKMVDHCGERSVSTLMVTAQIGDDAFGIKRSCIACRAVNDQWFAITITHK